MLFRCFLFHASGLFLTATTIFADPAPFGLEIGKATVTDAEKMYRIEKIGTNKSNNDQVFNVAVNQVNFEGLKELTLTFSTKDVLKVVYAKLPKSQFKSIHESLSKKYKVLNQNIPFVGDSYAEYVSGSTIVIAEAPHLSIDMDLIYIDKDLASEFEAKAKSKEAAKRKSQEDQL